MKKYGVLLLGGDRTHQENYGPDFAEDPRCQLIGLTDEAGVPSQRDAWNRSLAQRLGIPFFPHLDQALEREDVHIVCVCVEFERRSQLAARCAKAGKHVYVDKPIGSSVEAAEKLVSAAAEAQVKTQMFSMIRSAWSQRAKALVDSGLLGDLLGIHCDTLFAKGLAGSADLGRIREEHFPPRGFSFMKSKRELFTTGVYSIGMMGWLCGQSVERVYARTSNFFFREHQEDDIEDFAVVTVDFDGGLVGTLSGGRIGFLSHPLGGPLRVSLIGSRGTRIVDAAEPRLEISCDAKPWRPGQPHPQDPMAFWQSSTREAGEVHKFGWRGVGSSGGSDASFFVDCIEADRESDMSAREGADILKVLMAAYESAASGKVVSVA